LLARLGRISRPGVDLGDFDHLGHFDYRWLDQLGFDDHGHDLHRGW